MVAANAMFLKSRMTTSPASPVVDVGIGVGVGVIVEADVGVIVGVAKAAGVGVIVAVGKGMLDAEVGPVTGIGVAVGMGVGDGTEGVTSALEVCCGSSFVQKQAEALATITSRTHIVVLFITGVYHFAIGRWALMVTYAVSMNLIIPKAAAAPASCRRGLGCSKRRGRGPARRVGSWGLLRLR